MRVGHATETRNRLLPRRNRNDRQDGRQRAVNSVHSRTRSDAHARQVSDGHRPVIAGAQLLSRVVRVRRDVGEAGG